MTSYTHKSAGVSATQAGGAASLYTVPASTTTLVYGLTIANTYSAPISVSVKLLKSGATAFFLADAVQVQVGSTLSLIGSAQKMAMQATDVLQVIVNTASGTADAIISYLEMA